MTIDWNHFTPWASLAGGLLIGLAAAAFIFFNGRIAGISGIVGGLFRPKPGDIGWRLVFIAGLLLAPVVYSFALPLPEMRIDADLPTLIIAGLLVGL